MSPKHELSFLEFINSFRRGELLSEADGLLAEVIGAMQATGGNGEITLKLPFKFNKAGQIECSPQITAKRPRREMGVGIYFATDDGRLTRRDPNQLDMLDEIEARRARDHAD